MKQKILLFLYGLIAKRLQPPLADQKIFYVVYYHEKFQSEAYTSLEAAEKDWRSFSELHPTLYACLTVDQGRTI